MLPMKLHCSKSKISATYYIQRSVPIGDRTTTNTVEHLGSIEELNASCSDMAATDTAKRLSLAKGSAKR